MPVVPVCTVKTSLYREEKVSRRFRDAIASGGTAQRASSGPGKSVVRALRMYVCL